MFSLKEVQLHVYLGFRQKYTLNFALKTGHSVKQKNKAPKLGHLEWITLLQP